MDPKIFFKFVSISFQKQITYRFDYFVGILNGFLYVFIFTSLWKALYSQSDATEHNGFTLTAITTYAVMAMAVKISFSMEDMAICRKVRDGSVAMELIRPTSFFFMNMAENVGYSLFHFLSRAIPIVIISAFIFDIYVPLGPIRLLAFLLSAIMGYMILSMLNFITGLLSFWFVEIFPFMLFKYAIFTFFAGGIVPIDFFPEALKFVVNSLPFQHILYSPTIILMGKAPMSAIPSIILLQFIWTLIMSGICLLMWDASKRKLIIQGG